MIGSLDSHQPDQTNEDARRVTYDSRPAVFRRFKSTIPANYKSPTPVRVPLPPTPNAGSSVYVLVRGGLSHQTDE
jgi:hypothetical protein